MNRFSFTFFVVAFHIQVALMWSDIELVGFDNVRTGGLYRTYLKFKRVDKATYGVSGRIEILNDYSNDWQMEINIFRSALGNNQFVKMPYRIPKDGLCNIIDGIFTTSGIAKDVADASDFPQPKPIGGVCKDYKKGNYTMRGYTLVRPSTIPQFLPTGLYKAVITYSRDDRGENGSYDILAKLY